MEERTGIVHDEELSGKYADGYERKTLAEHVAYLALAAEETDDVCDKRTVGMKITDIEEIPKLQHYEESEKHS